MAQPGRKPVEPIRGGPGDAAAEEKPKPVPPVAEVDEGEQGCPPDPQHLPEDRFRVREELHGADEGDAVESPIRIVGQALGDVALVDGKPGRHTAQDLFFRKLYPHHAAGAGLEGLAEEGPVAAGQVEKGSPFRDKPGQEAIKVSLRQNKHPLKSKGVAEN